MNLQRIQDFEEGTKGGLRYVFDDERTVFRESDGGLIRFWFYRENSCKNLLLQEMMLRHCENSVFEL
jgi:hypothetical protein